MLLNVNHIAVHPASINRHNSNMIEEYSEVEAYRHLLSVAENIINSLQTDPNILNKYHQLKIALLHKVSPNAEISPQHTHHRKLLNTYKYVASSLLQAMAEFETQIEATMQRLDYSKKVIAIVKEWELRLDDLKASAEGLPQKAKLIAKEENSALSYYCAQFDGKLQNFGLLIEVHKKMHEIIEQAAFGQSQRGRRQEALQQNLHELQREVSEVRDGQAFVQQHRLTEREFKQFKIWSGKLSSLLFQ